MHAAVVTSFDHAPRYAELPTPTPRDGEVLVDVLAAGLHPRVRSGADGSHYTSGGALPMIPGVDGVGRLPDGRTVYFVADDTVAGTMAEKAVLDPRRSVVLPEGADPVTLAAAMNPAMSSWLALRCRIAFQAGQRVLVLGATGSAGQMAVQVARHLGASEIVAAGRDADRLEATRALGATTTVSLVGEPDDVAARLAAAAGDVDVVLDYTWGTVTEAAIPAIVRGRTDRTVALDWVQIGSTAGADITLPSAALRGANLRLLGSGQGSLGARTIVGELPALVEQIVAGAFEVDATAVPLADVESAWALPTGGRRVVLTV